MPNPKPQNGALAISNTGGRVIKSNGNIAVHDPEYVLWSSDSSEVVMWDGTSTNGLTWREYCGCCGVDSCGECADTISSLLIDLGVTTWTGENTALGGYYCTTPCSDLTGELSLTQNAYQLWVGEYTSPCSWYIAYSPFCHFQTDDPFVVIINVSMRYSGGSWVWQLKMQSYLWATFFGTGVYTYFLTRYVVYETATTTTCIGNFTLSKTIDQYYAIDSWEATIGYTPQPCYTAKPLWAWPSTIDLTTT